MTLLALPPKEAHIWYALPDELTDPSLLDAYRALMAPGERERQLRYYFEKNRHEYLVTRALVRTVLSRYADVHPSAWVFEAGEHGKPYIAWPEVRPGISFNLSNTTGMVACIVASEREVGVDVEEVERAVRAMEVADRFFSPSEVRALRALPEAEQPARFITYWTLKESYIKARGMGLAIPLDQFSFLIDPGKEPGIAFDPRLKDDPAAWQFARVLPTRRHAVAAAVRVAPGERVALSARKTVPLIY
jgi:4'-phosphopantetheinyl transferase